MLPKFDPRRSCGLVPALPRSVAPRAKDADKVTKAAQDGLLEHPSKFTGKASVPKGQNQAHSERGAR